MPLFTRCWRMRWWQTVMSDNEGKWCHCPQDDEGWDDGRQLRQIMKASDATVYMMLKGEMIADSYVRQWRQVMPLSTRCWRVRWWQTVMSDNKVKWCHWCWWLSQQVSDYLKVLRSLDGTEAKRLGERVVSLAEIGLQGCSPQPAVMEVSTYNHLPTEYKCLCWFVVEVWQTLCVCLGDEGG